MQIMKVEYLGAHWWRWVRVHTDEGITWLALNRLLLLPGPST